MQRTSLRTVAIVAGIATALPAAAVLGIRVGWEGFLGAVILGIAVLQPIAAAVILVRACPGRSSVHLAAYSGLGGLAAAFLLGMVNRDSDRGGFLSLVVQVFVALPFFGGGLLAWWYGRRLDGPLPHLQNARRLFAVSLFAGMLLATIPLGSLIRAHDVARAKRFIEGIAREARRENAGLSRDGLQRLLERQDYPPFLIERSFQVSSGEDGVTSEFTRGTFMGVEGWTYHVSTGTWEHWVD